MLSFQLFCTRWNIGNVLNENPLIWKNPFRHFYQISVPPDKKKIKYFSRSIVITSNLRKEKWKKKMFWLKKINSIVLREAQNHAILNVRDAKPQWSATISRGNLVRWAVGKKENIFVTKLVACVYVCVNCMLRIAILLFYFWDHSICVTQLFGAHGMRTRYAHLSFHHSLVLKSYTDAFENFFNCFSVW